MSLGKTLVKTGQLSPDKLQEIEKQAESLAEEITKDPRLFAEAMEKLSGPLPNPDELRGFGKAWDVAQHEWPVMLGRGAIIGGMGAIAEGGIQGAKALASHFHKKKCFEAMMQQNPQLKELPDQNKVMRSFDTMYRFNPSYASDPNVAGSVVKIMHDQEYLDTSMIKGFIEANQRMQGGGGKNVYDFMSGLKGNYDPEKNQREMESHRQRLSQDTEAHHQRMAHDKELHGFNRDKAESDAAAALHKSDILADEDEKRQAQRTPTPGAGESGT
jgi:hypothetical protein